MSGFPVVLFSGIARRVALAVVCCGVIVLAVGLLLQTGKQQRQYRDQNQQQLQLLALQTASGVRSRLDAAATLLRALTGQNALDRSVDAALLRKQLVQSGQFRSAAVLRPAAHGDFTALSLPLQLTVGQRAALAAGGSVLLTARPSGTAVLLLMREVQGAAPRWVVAELAPQWLWEPLQGGAHKISVIALDAPAEHLFQSADSPDAMVSTAWKALLDVNTAVGDLAWNAGGTAWVGAATQIGGLATRADMPLGVVVATPDRPWSVAFWSALRTQSTLLPIVLLFAALFAHWMARGYVRTFRQLRRALTLLPERRVPVLAEDDACTEIQQVVASFNHAAETIEIQAETRRALEEIDGLLQTGGDYEGVLDQVLTRVRAVTRANNVGLTLVGPGMSGYGRLFSVDATGGCPVNRVLLDEQMSETLRQSRTGLTVVRCEPGRHSFLEPLQAAGSGFFWVWPVIVGDELAAILAIGYREPPRHGARIAACGTQCAQRLGASLSTNARAERLYRQAHFDPMTQLPNRLLFRDQLTQELIGAAKSGSQGALLYIDLDHFKKVNDSLGHAAGDQLLAIVAQRLRACVKEADTVARLGGDEFAIILRGAGDAADVTAVADRIIEAMQAPMRLGGKEHHVRASIGISLYPGDGMLLDELLRNADLAMYRAKDQGRGAAVFFNAKMAARSARVADSGLYRAMKHREFSLYFQPQYRISDGSLAGVEALLRWQKPRNEMLTSAQFVPAAEESGLIVDLGGWVIDVACAQLAQWRDQGVTPPAVAINLSVQQLRDPDLPNAVKRALDRYRIAPAILEFEVNEAALTDPDSQSCVEQLAALGVRLTLDDFGTGHTALANLRRYPVTTVKIDRSFVADLVENPSAAALASTIIVMAHSLGKRVVAEGVETIDQLDYLRERGCDVAQGFFLARPLSVADMTDLMLGRKPQPEAEQSAIA